MAHLYLELAQELAGNIERGIYAVGERLPGVRAISKLRGVSIATVISAYRQLETNGYIEAKPRSGFVVKPRYGERLAAPATSKPPKTPKAVTAHQMILQLAQTSRQAGLVNFGAAVPSTELLPIQAVSQVLAQVAKNNRHKLCNYDFPWSEMPLSRQIAKRLQEIGCPTNPDDIVITNGCQEAVVLALKTITKPGDIVAVESPTFHGLLQAIDVLGLKALEIPTDPQHGISVAALELAFEQWPVKACIVVPNFQNPLGFVMPDSAKKALVELAGKYKVPLIEDDIYGELAFDHRRPSLLKHYDKNDMVIHCSSVSKSLAPGLRIGWVVSPRNVEQLRYQKFVNNCATSTMNQLAVAEFLRSGRYDRHLRTLRTNLSQAVSRIIDRVGRYFPDTTKITQPSGGYVIWLELPKHIDSKELTHQALEQKISIAPGWLFSPSQKYAHCIRLNCALPWSDEVDHALMKLGNMIANVQPYKI